MLGGNGASKTTVIKLLLRLYELQSGTIYVDEYDLRRINLWDLRRASPAVQQCIVIYSLSVRKNISLIDDRSISDEMIRWAAERTGIKPYPESSDYTFDDEVTRRFNDNGVLYVYLQ